MVSTLDDLERRGGAFVPLLACLVDRLARRGSRELAAKHLRGLPAPVECENRWQVASVGVPRQDRGTAGEVERCRIGVPLSDATSPRAGRVPGPAPGAAPGLVTQRAGVPEGGELSDQAGARDRRAGSRPGAGGAEVLEERERLGALIDHAGRDRAPVVVVPSHGAGGWPRTKARVAGRVLAAARCRRRREGAVPPA